MLGHARRKSRLLEQLAGVLLLLLIAVVGTTPLLSAALDCCAAATFESALHGHADESSHDECDTAGGSEVEHCPCPLPCSPGCTGHTLRALVTPITPIEVAAPRGAPLLRAPPEQRPSAPEPGEILHVPKPQHA